jgi:YaiO family outer membrane protein
MNRSSPGSIDTHAQFVALTYGHQKQDVITARYGWGGEGYQAIAENVTLIDFQSKEMSLAWRHWLDNNLGLLTGVEHYSNPYYQRNGVSIGLFYQFQ